MTQETKLKGRPRRQRPARRPGHSEARGCTGTRRRPWRLRRAAAPKALTILFIRHATPVTRQRGPAIDADRPLSEEAGAKQAKRLGGP